MRAAGLLVAMLVVALSACGGPEGLGCGGERVPAADLVPTRYEVSELPDEALSVFRARLGQRTDKDFSIDGITVEPEAAVLTMTFEAPIGRADEELAGGLDDLESFPMVGTDGYGGRGANGQALAIAKLGRCAAVIVAGTADKPVRRIATSLALGAGDDRRGKPRANTRRLCRDAEPLKAADVVPEGTRIGRPDLQVLGAMTRSLERRYPGASETDGVSVGSLDVVTLTLKNGLVGEADLAGVPGRAVDFGGEPGRLDRAQGISVSVVIKDCSFVYVIGSSDRGVRRLTSRLDL